MFQRKSTNPASYELAVELIRSAKERLQLYLAQDFSEKIIAVEGGSDALSVLEEAHRILVQLYHVCPDILSNVIPQLVEELKVSLQMR